MLNGNKIVCPYCEKSYFQQGATMTTAVYYPPVWKDGVNINPDRNVSTTTCYCLECGNRFYVQECAGEIKVSK